MFFFFPLNKQRKKIIKKKSTTRSSVDHGQTWSKIANVPSGRYWRSSSVSADGTKIALGIEGAQFGLIFISYDFGAT